MPLDPGAIRPGILCTVVWYLTPLYVFRPVALFTRLSLSTRWRRQTRVTRQLYAVYFYSPAKVVTIWLYVVALMDILQVASVKVRVRSFGGS